MLKHLPAAERAHSGLAGLVESNTLGEWYCMCVRGILPRIGFLELLCEMVTERWRLSLNMCETGRRCVRACERKRRSNLNVKERLWVITKWIAVQTKMSMVWDCGPVPIYHRMLERLHQLCEVFFNHTSCLKTVMVADQVQKSQQTSLIFFSTHDAMKSLDLDCD